jgi:hypothetical protein
MNACVTKVYMISSDSKGIKDRNCPVCRQNRRKKKVQNFYLSMLFWCDNKRINK